MEVSLRTHTQTKPTHTINVRLHRKYSHMWFMRLAHITGIFAMWVKDRDLAMNVSHAAETPQLSSHQ